MLRIRRRIAIGLVGSLVTAALVVASCSSQPRASTFEIGPLPENLVPVGDVFAKHLTVFDIPIVATASTDDAKMVHAANVMAQYLDNDADGAVDVPEVVEAMIGAGALLVMFATEAEMETVDVASVPADFVESAQGLYGSETNPARGFDASLEEIHHLILNTGWAQVYPDQLGQEAGSAIADAMDAARGGHFETVPARYPAGAWFTYDDRTCDYNCMLTEYTYWIHTALLGAQLGRRNEIGHEWRFETPDEARNGDPDATRIIDAPELRLPTRLPDGNYHR